MSSAESAPEVRPQGGAAAWLTPQWDAPMPGVGACMSTRRAPMDAGPASFAPFDAFNLGDHVGDDPDAVAGHRQALARCLGVQAVWMNQVHGDRVIRLGAGHAGPGEVPQADGAWTDERGVACAVMVADCLPILLAVDDGRAVAALHAGWRGLAGRHPDGTQGPGIVMRGVQALCEGTGCDPAQIRAWIGPCIGPSAFEVGDDVLEGFGLTPGAPGAHFRPKPQADGRKWVGDLVALASDRLAAAGVRHVAGGHWCTFSDSERFFSYRRDGRTGRQAALIWRR